jgi:preprotein translocase subunit Sec63
MVAKTLYDVLGVSKTASEDDIKSAFKKLAKIYDQSLRYGGVKRTPQPRYDYTYLGYADTYGWSLRHQKEWNEHHNMMYG